MSSYATSYVPNPGTSTMLRVADVAEIGPGPEFDALFGVPTFGPELVTSLNLTTASTAGAVTGTTVNTFTTSGAGGVRLAGIVTVGKRYRLQITGTTTASEVYVRNPANLDGNQTLATGAFSASWVVRWSQVSEIYIQNLGAGVTTITSLSVVEELREGTIVVEWVDMGSTDGDILALHSGGTTNELLSLYYSGSSILTLCRAGSANQLAATVGTRIPNALNKAAISWGAAGLSVVLNGGTVQANASATIPAPTHARIAGTALASSAQGARKLTKIGTLTTQRTGAALQALTV